MFNGKFIRSWFFDRPRNIIAVILIGSVFLVLGCDLSSLTSSGNNEALQQSLIQTQTALNVQMTVMAQEAQNKEAQQQIMLTQSAMIVQSTLQAQPTQTSDTSDSPQPSSQDEGTPQTQPSEEEKQTDLAGFDEWKKEAHILLYEDITGKANVKRTVSDALENLSLTFDDARSNAGIFLDKIGKTPGKDGWDVIIASLEDRRGVGGGDFYEPLRSAIQNGSAVIMEQWNLDASRAKASGLLGDCGVEFQKDFNSEFPMGLAGQVLYVLDPTNPIANEPHDNLRISDVTGFWTKNYPIGTTDYDYGDKLHKLSGSKAVIVFGLNVNEPETGTVVSCIDGRLTLVTVSTHGYASERIRPLWENMIYQALKARYSYEQNH